jgi:hypothetical protein
VSGRERERFYYNICITEMQYMSGNGSGDSRICEVRTNFWFFNEEKGESGLGWEGTI